MGFVEAEVKALSVEQRKNIVVERIEVGKVYAAARPDNQNMRDKLLILLRQRVLLRCARRCSTLVFMSWRKPETTSPEACCEEWLPPRPLVTLT